MSPVTLNTNKMIQEATLKTIKKVWAKYPECRLTQLLVNTINPSEFCPEIYYTEDSRLIELLNDLVVEEAETLEVSTNTIHELLMLHNEMLGIFCSKVTVGVWMLTPNPAIGGEMPMSMMASAQGRKTLKQVLSKMKNER